MTRLATSVIALYHALAEGDDLPPANAYISDGMRDARLACRKTIMVESKVLTRLSPVVVADIRSLLYGYLLVTQDHMTARSRARDPLGYDFRAAQAEVYRGVVRALDFALDKVPTV